MAEGPVSAAVMQAMVLERPAEPLQQRERPVPEPDKEQILLRMLACGVCRTDLHVVDNELPDIPLPIVPGHEVVGVIERIGSHVQGLKPGERVGVPWLAWTCGECRYCRRDQENLCERARFTGYQIDGGYAEYMLADYRYVLRLDAASDPVTTAPLLCAGLIGYRSLNMTGQAKRLGLYGFGAAAHIVCQIARYQEREVYAFTRPGDAEAQAFARQLGAVWAGGSDEDPPAALDAAILYAPVGALVPAALGVIDRGGIVVCAGIHMSDIPEFPYRLLWQERRLVSVANLTRRDGEAFRKILREVPIKTETRIYPLSSANMALADLRSGRFRGAAVLVPDRGR